MDIVFIEQLEVHALIGVHPFERTRERPLLIDLELGIDNPRAARRDSLHDSVDYDAVCTQVARLARTGRFNLIETLAERIADMLASDFRIAWLRLRISKPGAVAAARGVGVIIERGRRS